MTEQTTTTDLTETVPTLEPTTRNKIKRGATIAFVAVGAILLVDDGIKRFKNRKTVTVTVEDKPEN